MQERAPSVSVCVCVSWLEERILQRHPRTRFQRFRLPASTNRLAADERRLSALFVCREKKTKKKCKASIK